MSGRRANGEGSIYQRADGRWEFPSSSTRRVASVNAFTPTEEPDKKSTTILPKSSLKLARVSVPRTKSGRLEPSSTTGSLMSRPLRTGLAP